MKLIICFLCNTAFTPVEKIKKCDCGQSSGRIINNIVHYSGVGAKAIWISDIIIKDEISANIDATAVIEKQGKHLSDDDRIFYTRVIEYLNQKADTSHSVKFPSSNSVLILSRRDELNCPIEDFFRVIDNKVVSWKGSNMEVYLRPKTLFNKTNFLNYIGEKNARPQQIAEKSFQQFTGAAEQAKSNLLRTG